MLLCACVFRSIVVAVLAVGLVLRGDKRSAADKPWSQCLVTDEHESKEYRTIRSIIISKHPDMEASIATFGSNARKALCWFVYGDALGMDIILEAYQVVQRFTLLALMYFYFVSEDVRSISTSNWLTGAVHECEWDHLKCKKR